MNTFVRTLLLCVCLGVFAFAQSTGTIQGTVTDTTGAVIPGAGIKVTNLHTGVVNNVTSNSVGFYAVPALGPGRYSMECSSSGFAASNCLEIRLELAKFSVGVLCRPPRWAKPPARTASTAASPASLP